jgi:hypothetical protein
MNAFANRLLRYSVPVLLLVAVLGPQPQAQAPPPASKLSSLDQLLAPIALYPDALLAQWEVPR